MFIFERERERERERASEHASRGRAEREGDTESETEISRFDTNVSFTQPRHLNQKYSLSINLIYKIDLNYYNPQMISLFH